MAAYPEYISKGTRAETVSGSTCSPTFMSGIVAGDLLLCLAVNEGNTIISAPSGFTAFTESPQAIRTDVKAALFYKVAAGSETGALSVGTSGGSLVYMMAQIYNFRISPLNLMTREDCQGRNGQNTTATYDAVTLAGSGRSLYTIIANWDEITTPGVPTGYTAATTDTSTSRLGIIFKISEKTNVSSDGSVTAGGSISGWATWHLALYDYIAPAGADQGGSFIVN